MGTQRRALNVSLRAVASTGNQTCLFSKSGERGGRERGGRAVREAGLALIGATRRMRRWGRRARRRSGSSNTTHRPCRRVTSNNPLATSPSRCSSLTPPCASSPRPCHTEREGFRVHNTNVRSVGVPALTPAAGVATGIEHVELGATRGFPSRGGWLGRQACLHTQPSAPSVGCHQLL